MLAQYTHCNYSTSGKFDYFQVTLRKSDFHPLFMPSFLPNENYFWVARFGKPQPLNDGNLHLGENGFSYVAGLEVFKGFGNRESAATASYPATPCPSDR